jgi:hypothetical protein
MNEFLTLPPYSLSTEQKECTMLEECNVLTSHHLIACKDYHRIFEAFAFPRPPYKSLQEMPYLPVTLFKKYPLMSIPQNEVYKTLLSSGTTQSQLSKIFLDRKTAKLQTQALAAIMTHFIGPKRLPMLLIESEDLIQNPRMFSARGAALLGMLNFGREPLYLLDKNGTIQRDRLLKWAAQHKEEPVLIFGLTYMVWKYLLNALREEEIHLPHAFLFHTGGWKKLQDEAVTPEEFKAKALAVVGIQRCHNFYGFVEQVGSVYVECEMGLLHCPNFAEIIIRDPIDWQEITTGNQGVIQAISLLPWSYPGHSLLTEDLGELVGFNNCRCGRHGKTFKILGRVPRAEPRGCSDVTYE